MLEAIARAILSDWDIGQVLLRPRKLVRRRQIANDSEELHRVVGGQPPIAILVNEGCSCERGNPSGRQLLVGPGHPLVKRQLVLSVE
eukprot:scaffold158828_cov32-Tisochrysis_lutea.AAC.5